MTGFAGLSALRRLVFEVVALSLSPDQVVMSWNGMEWNGMECTLSPDQVI